MKSIFNYNLPQLQQMLSEQGFKSFSAKQVFAWLYKRRVFDVQEMSDLNKGTRQHLSEQYSFDLLALKTKQVSSDGTIKYLFETEDKSLVETVLMSHNYGYSICVTTQLGCSMGCKFCASGLIKKQRDLTTAEMVLQVLQVQKYLDETDMRISNMVIMGTGEPFDNFDAVMNFIDIVNEDQGLGIGARRITVSTCGIVPAIKKFADLQSQVNLAISLHAPNQEIREELMPIAKAYPLPELMDSLKYYLAKNNRRLTFEYILLKDVNDSVEHAQELAKLIRGMNAYVNLIPYNEVDEHLYKTSSFKQSMKFYDQLKRNHIQVTLRKEHGSDIDAACGQLRSKHIKRGTV